MRTVMACLTSLAVIVALDGVGRAETKEVYWKGFYRSPNGRVIVQFPASMTDGNASTAVDANGLRAFTFKGANVMTLVMVPGAPVAKDKQKQVFGELSKAFFSSAGPVAKLDPAKRPQAGEQNTSAGLASMIRADGQAGTLLALWIADGDDAMGVFIAGMTKDVEKAASSIVDHARVGAKVPVLADRNPGLRLAGLYSTVARPKDAAWTADFRVFDPRGYVSEVTPSTPITLDVEALVQRASLGEPTWVYTYKIEAGKLVQQPLTAWGKPTTKSFEPGTGSLKIDGEGWFATRANELASVVGDWRAVQMANTSGPGGGGMNAKFEDRIVLRADGTAWYGNENGIVGDDRNDRGAIKWTFGGASAGEWKGTYKAAGDRIHVTTADGRKFSLLVVAGRSTDGSARTNVAFIGGTGYRRDK